MSTKWTLGVLRRKTCEIPQDASEGANEAYTVTTRQRFMCRLATRLVSIEGRVGLGLKHCKMCTY
jgi:hypothetical protein